MLNSKKRNAETRRRKHLSLWSIGFSLSILTLPAWSSATLTERLVQSERGVIEKRLEEPLAVMPFSAFGAMAAEPERFIVTLENSAVAHYRGGVQGFEATSTEGRARLDVQTPEARAYGQFLEIEQTKLLQAINRTLGRTVEPLDQYTTAINAMVLPITQTEAERLAGLAGIRSIVKDELYQLNRIDSGVTQGFATPGTSQQAAPQWPWLVLAGVLAMAVLALLWAIATRRLNRRHGVLASLLATLGLAGCLWEGGFAWIGAPEVWRGVGNKPGTMGEGIVVGIIDTGINPVSDSFAAVDAEGYRHHNPAGRYFGVCDPGQDVFDASFPCNDKLIGAWGHPLVNDGNARDLNGHGSHVGGTAAGNIVRKATVTAPSGFTITKDIAGVAPRANLISYAVCGEAGCYLSAILFAINQAIEDGVDVINYSIGGGSNDPWGNPSAMAYLAAMDAGIFVATSAGNSGPNFATLGSPADAPWITSVAASSHNYLYKNSLVDMSGGMLVPPSDILGQSIAPGYGPALIVDAADYDNPLCLEGEFSARFDGEIVLCEAGVIGRVAKGANVKENGGGALVLTREPTTPDGSGYLEADTHVLPATQITFSDALRVRQWLASGHGHRARLTGTQTVRADDYADVLAYFSSRGVNPSVPSVVKPNITAPGRAIFAAFHEGFSDADQDYNIIQGTSMSSPHIAGAGALMKSLYPHWSPMQIQSAMMTTAVYEHYKEDGRRQADAFDVGSGRIDLPKAVQAALVLDEQLDQFLAADPLAGGDPSQLNLTGMGQHNCVVNCSWVRTLTNEGDRSGFWRVEPQPGVTVTPRQFRLAPGQSVQMQVSVDVVDRPVNEWAFKRVKLRSMTRGLADAHFPIAALSTLSNLPGTVNITAPLASDTVELPGLRSIEITAAHVQLSGLAKASLTEGALVSDPTNGNPFDGSFDPEVDGTQFIVVDVPEGATRLVAEITASESTDLDLFVGVGEVPSFGTLVDYAATAAALEYVNIDNPPAGKMWVLVQNWQPGYDEPQAFSLHTAVVGGEVGNFNVDVPYSVPAGEAFSAQIGFNLIGSEPGDRYYGAFALGTDSSAPGNLGTVRIDLVRE